MILSLNIFIFYFEALISSFFHELRNTCLPCSAPSWKDQMQKMLDNYQMQKMLDKAGVEYTPQVRTNRAWDGPRDFTWA